MRITVLTENTTCREGLVPEHGLSLYIETGAHKILFDMGQSDLFLTHAKALGVEIAAVDVAVLSHGHYDHGGGLAAFLAANQKAPVYVNENAFAPHYRKDGSYIGLDPALAEHERLRRVGECQEIDDTLSLFACNTRKKPYGLDTAGLCMGAPAALRPEDFCHEQYLLIREGEKTVLISGCSHKGILNIVDWFAPDVLVGGFHLNKYATIGEGAAALDRIAARLLEGNTRYYTCHCTGEPQYAYLKDRMEERLHYLSCGTAEEI
ncbi:MAG: MBL fold metallo-hydrolase [Clostridia bacterium]|nr:MBL fold metallo-hydrolase [Clostridia bacterium]